MIRLRKVAAIVLIPAQVLLAVPVAAQSTPVSNERKTDPAEVTARKTLPRTQPVPLWPEFSAVPTDLEIFRARVFDEPLVPIGATTPSENQQLAEALAAYLKGNDNEDVTPIAAFLSAKPSSAWRAALLTGLGILYRSTGYYSRALDAWEEAWAASRHATEPKASATADRAVAELIELTRGSAVSTAWPSSMPRSRAATSAVPPVSASPPPGRATG